MSEAMPLEDEKIQGRNESFYRARRQFDDARSFIQLAERIDDWEPNAMHALVRAASREMDEASTYFYKTNDDRGVAK